MKYFRKKAMFGLMVTSLIAMYSDAKANEEVTKSQLSMKIIELSNRFDSTKPAGVLKLLFKNEGEVNVDLRFCGTLSFGGASVLERRKLTPTPSYFWILPNGYRSFGGAFAAVKYEWRNEDGTIAASGTYDVSYPTCTIEPHKSVNLCIPILLPSSPGVYELYATFDNSSMQAIADSCSNTFPSLSKLGIFNASDRIKIIIPNSSTLTK